MEKNNRIEVKCETCGKTFDRFICHPYITKCKECRGTKKKTSKTSTIVDGVKVTKDMLDTLMYMSSTGYIGKVDTPSSLSMVTYIQRRTDTRFWRIGSEVFLSIKEMADRFPYLYDNSVAKRLLEKEQTL